MPVHKKWSKTISNFTENRAVNGILRIRPTDFANGMRSEKQELKVYVRIISTYCAFKHAHFTPECNDINYFPVQQQLLILMTPLFAPT